MLCLIFHAKIKQKLFLLWTDFCILSGIWIILQIYLIIIILVMRYFSCYSKKINMSDHAKGKFLWHIQWLTATAFLATKSLQWFQMLKSPFQIDAIFSWQFCAKKIEDTHILANLGIILFYFIFDRSLVEKKKS